MSNSDYIKPIFDFFINSSDFNGIPMCQLFDIWGLNWENGCNVLIGLIESGDCIIQSSSNPHIIHSSIPTVECSVYYLNEIKTKKADKFHQFSECVYPSTSFLNEHRKIDNLSPYEKRLAIGEPQLKPLFFDFEVLNEYLDNPKYKLRLKDYRGSLSYELSEDKKIDKAGYYELKTFGLGYDENGVRVLVAFPRDLKCLSLSQQNHWEEHELSRPCKVLKFYWDNIMMGNWWFPHSLASGVIDERNFVNILWERIFEEKLFLNVYSIETLPVNFCFLFIPTQKALRQFNHQMDKLFSDDMNVKHLRKLLKEGFHNLQPVSEKYEEPIGSLKALELWLNNIYILEDGTRIGAEIVKPFKAIRKARQPEAHKIIVEDKYDISIYREQNRILDEVYNALKKLRIVLSSHPICQGIKPPEGYSSEAYPL